MSDDKQINNQYSSGQKGKPKTGLRYLNAMMNNVMNGLRSGLTGGYHSADTKHQRAWQDYGYPEQISFERHWNMYRRNGIAKRGIQAPVDECWRDDPILVDGEDPDEAEEVGNGNTKFIRDIEWLNKNLQLFKRLKAADLRQRVGRYGGLIFQVRGESSEADWVKPLGRIRRTQLVRAIPAYEGQLEVGEHETNPTSERYGMPITYNYNEANVGGRSEQATRSVVIHWTRVVTLAEDADDGSIYGIPANEAGFNDLLNLEKIIGASAEGAWKNAAQKLIFKDNLGADGGELGPDEVDAQDEAIAAFSENLDKQLVIGGMDVQNMQSSLQSPKDPFDIALSSYSASVNQPHKILIGAQTGRLASDEDGNAWLRYCQSRCENWCSDAVRAVIDWLLEHGVITPPASGGYSVHWGDLLAPSDADKLDIVDKMATINQKLIAMGEVPFSVDEMRLMAGYETRDLPAGDGGGVELEEDEVEDEVTDDEQGA